LCVASLFAISEHGFMIVPMTALFALAFYMLMEFRAAKDRKLSPGAAEAPSDTPSRETVSQP
jgi:small neutral amino acid transporter SnatA (MarC family)